MKYLFITLVSIFLTACNTSQQIPKTTTPISAKTLFENEQYKESIVIFEQQNTPEAHYYLGKAYLYGMGVEINKKKAFNYAQLAADAKYPAGINLLAFLYANGDGVEKDELQALVYYKEAAKLGNTKAMMNIGEMYAVGRFVKPDVNQSIYWVKKAYENNSVRAIRVLGNLYASNQVKDYEEAIKYYNLFLAHKEADESKISSVYLRLGDTYEELNNRDKSIYYYRKSAELNNEDSIITLIYMKNRDDYFSEDEYLQLMKKGVELKDELAYLPLYMYYLDNGTVQEQHDYLYKSYYEDHNIAMGCQLANEYREEYNYMQANLIANEIVSQNPNSNIPSCYHTLVYLYTRGHGVAKDINRAISLQKQLFRTSKDYYKDDAAESLAKLYLEELHDYTNAQKWYEITFNLTQNEKYLIKVEEYKNSLAKYQDNNLENIKQKIYPIIDTYTKKKQVASALETKNYYFISTDQKSVNMYDKKTLELKRELRGWIGDGLDGMVLQMAYDEINNLLYCAGVNSSVDLSKNDLIKVFDIKTGKIVKTINNKNAMKSIYLNISDDGKFLVSINGGILLNIINTEDNEIQHYNFANIVSFTKANIVETNNDYLINVLGNDNNLYTFSINERRQIKKEKFADQTKFKSFNGTHAEKILTNKKSSNSIIQHIKIKKGQIFIDNNQLDKIKMFDLNNLALYNTTENIDFINSTNSNIDIRYKNSKTTVKLYKDSKFISDIQLSNNNNHALKHQIIDEKYIIFITNDISVMYIFNLQGKAIAKLKGFQSIQSNIIYQNGNLITYGGDNIIHIWNLDNLDTLNKIEKNYDEEILTGVNKVIGGNILEMLKLPDNDLSEISKLQSKQNGLPYILTPKQLKSFVKMFLSKKEEIYPIASLYIKNDEWIIYNNRGYFASSKNGNNLIRYHLNQGLKKEAKIIDNTQIFEKFYRPDIIKKLLAKKTVSDTLDIKQVLKNINAPSVSIIGNKFKDSKNLELTYKICDNGSGVSNTSILLNNIQKNSSGSRGFSIEKKDSKNKCTTYRNMITLQSGKNTIAIKSFDKSKTISTTTKAIEVIGKFKAPTKSNLHFLSIAVSNYRDKALQLQYSVSDVKAVKSKLLHHSKDLFENIYTYDLHEKNVTQKKLDEIFNKISKKITINDVFILYIAGHGVTSEKDGLYYFLPYDITNTSYKGLVSSAISVNDIKHQLGKINAKKSLILLDTCNSGGAIDTLASRGLEERMALERLSYATGRNYIVASSKNQVALEGYKNHGVFTYSVLEAFDRAYFGEDTTLTVTSLASFVEKTVPQLTKEKFHYEQFPQKYLNGNDFPIGMKNDN